MILLFIIFLASFDRFCTVTRYTNTTGLKLTRQHSSSTDPFRVLFSSTFPSFSLPSSTATNAIGEININSCRQTQTNLTMLFSKLSKQIPLLHSLSQYNSILKIPSLNLNRFIQPFAPGAYNANSSFQFRSFMVSNNGSPSKSPSVHSSSSRLFLRNYSYVSSSASATKASQDKKSEKTLWRLMGLVVGMVGLTYASVPLYRTFCQVTGYGGTVQRRETVEEKIARHTKDGTAPTRELVVQFNADVADGMQWKFIPTQREVRVKPGESALAFYTAENRSSTPITGVSTYNVTPMKAGKYFNKIQCFCFEEQCLLPGEQIDMPVFFYIDPEIETDPTMDGVNNLILSYTFFKAKSPELQNASQ